MVRPEQGSEEKLFENELRQEVVEAFENILKAQTETYGVFEIEYLSSLIKQFDVKSVLDIGTGDGSFLLELAKRFKGLQFVGIDHNDSFLNRAEKQQVAQGVVNVKFEKAFFDSTYPSDGFDMMLARFVLQHSSKPEEFLMDVYRRLSSGGVCVIMDEFLFDCDLDEAPWQSFYKRWIKGFQLAGADHRRPSKIPGWCHKIGFRNIRSSIQMYSPATIGGEQFKRLLMCVTKSLNRVFPDVWDNAFLATFEDWLNEIVRTRRVDPFITVAHVTAEKAKK